MSDYDNTNRFAVWPNKERRPDKRDAHWTGTINVEGREYWINAWKKADDASENAPSISGSIRPKQAKQDVGRDSTPPEPDFDDSIPF